VILAHYSASLNSGLPIPLEQWFSTWGSFAFFLGVARASDENMHDYFSILYFVYGTILVVAKILGPSSKNDSLLLHSKL